METALLLAANQNLQESRILQKTVRLRSDGFVFLYPILLAFLFLLGRKRTQKKSTEKSGLQNVYLSLTLFLNTLLSFGVNYIIKFFIERERPYLALGLPIPEEELTLTNLPPDSFPSDHAAVSMTIATTLLFRGYRTKNKGIKSLGRGFLIISLMMGRGRISIAIHRPTDILAGFFIGFLVAYITTIPYIQSYLAPLWNQCFIVRNHIIGIFKKK